MLKYLICIGLLRHHNSFISIYNKYKGIDARYPLVYTENDNNYLIYKNLEIQNILIKLKSNKILTNEKLLIIEKYKEYNKIKPINNIIENTEFDNLIYFYQP